MKKSLVLVLERTEYEGIASQGELSKE